MAAPLPGSCSFYVEKKRRFCKMVPAKGRRFCGEHATMEAESSRIACPLDPKHTVSLDKLVKHLKKCNSRRKPTPVYYVENINSGAAGEEEDAQEVSLSELSRSQLDALLERLRTAARGVPIEVEEGFLSHPALQSEIDDPRNGDSAHKHLEQQSSILGHLQALGLLGRGRCFVEFGAGRGKLSHWIHEALKAPQQQEKEDLQLLLVERSSTRFKVDGKHQDGGATLERLQVDIQHLDLAKVPLLQQRKLPLVAVGKHLCGAATDLALRCLLGPPEEDHHQGEPPTKRHKASQAAAGSPDGGAAAGALDGTAAAGALDGTAAAGALDGTAAAAGPPGGGETQAEGTLGGGGAAGTPGDGGAAAAGTPGDGGAAAAGTPGDRGAAAAETPGDRGAAAAETPGRGAAAGTAGGGAGQSSTEDCIPGPLQGLVVALCCHHRCQWRHYVGQSFFRQRGLGAADFSAFCRMSSWATCGLRASSQSPEELEDTANQRGEEEEHDMTEMPEVVSSSLLSAQQRHQVGLLCKRLIDYGRLDFLRSRGFNGHLQRYVDHQVTLENVLLSAVPLS